MISPALPAELKAALDAKLDGQSRTAFIDRAARISQTYREGGGSGTIRSENDALAYALTRMPATYAAVAASLNAISEINPGFAPKSMLDVGAGPGTATGAATAAFPSLNSFFLLDSNRVLRSLALDLSPHGARSGGLTYVQGDAHATVAMADTADLVIASYVIGELGETERRELLELMWAKTADTLLILEPGTPAGFSRIVFAREQLIAAGAHVAAPCPHDSPCPLRQPDWCHFAQRLPRSRAHRELKGAELPFEDEKFTYLALSRTAIAPRFSRVLAEPVSGKAGISAKLCTADGLVMRSVPRRDKAAYARARRWRWGDAVMNEE